MYILLGVILIIIFFIYCLLSISKKSDEVIDFIEKSKEND